MQGAPGYALGGFIRNTAVDLGSTKTIQGELQHLTSFCKEQKYLGARGKIKIIKKAAESASPFLVPNVTMPSTPKHTHLPCTTCWSELLLLRKWDNTFSHAGRWSFPPIPAARSWRLPCSIRFKISGALRFSFLLLVGPLMAELHSTSLIASPHRSQGKQSWKVE